MPIGLECSPEKTLPAPPLLPDRKLATSLEDIRDHEKFAAFVCTLTALYVARLEYVAVGDLQGGAIVLPPLNLGGLSASGRSPWVWFALYENLAKVQQSFPDPNIRINGESHG